MNSTRAYKQENYDDYWREEFVMDGLMVRARTQCQLTKLFLTRYLLRFTLVEQNVI